MPASGAAEVLVLKGDNMAAYGFGEGHPFGPDRHDVFHAELAGREFGSRLKLSGAEPASREDLETFHTSRYIDLQAQTKADQSADGRGKEALKRMQEQSNAEETLSNETGAVKSGKEAQAQTKAENNADKRGN